MSFGSLSSPSENKDVIIIIIIIITKYADARMVYSMVALEYMITDYQNQIKHVRIMVEKEGSTSLDSLYFDAQAKRQHLLTCNVKKQALQNSNVSQWICKLG